MSAEPALTVNPLITVATSEPVVTNMFLRPITARGSTETLAEAAVGEVTVRELMVIPGPKLAMLVPWAKCVNAPVSVIVLFWKPCGNAVVPRDNNVGTPGVTLKPFTSVACSPAVVAVMECGPTVAFACNDTVATRLVGEITVAGALLWKASDVTTVVPCRKCVCWPVIFNIRFCLPCGLLLGVTKIRVAGPGVTLIVLLTISPPVVTPMLC